MPYARALDALERHDCTDKTRRLRWQEDFPEHVCLVKTVLRSSLQLSVLCINKEGILGGPPHNNIYSYTAIYSLCIHILLYTVCDADLKSVSNIERLN